jgi:hypothetical protein
LIMEFRACHRLFGSRKCTLRHASWSVRPKDCNAGRESRYRLVGELPTPMNEARVGACYHLFDRHVAVSLANGLIVSLLGGQPTTRGIWLRRSFHPMSGFFIGQFVIPRRAICFERPKAAVPKQSRVWRVQWLEYLMKSCCIPAWPRSSPGLSCSRRRPGLARAVIKLRIGTRRRSRRSTNTSAITVRQLRQRGRSGLGAKRTLV